MKKKSKSSDVISNVSGGKKSRDIDIDERGKVRNKDDGGSRTGTAKKKKVKREKHEPVVIEDNTYKVGQEKKKKKRASGVTIEGKALVLSDGLPATVAGKKGLAAKKEKALKALEVYETLPPPVDEFDAEARRMFEKQVELAMRLEEQMEDRIYNRDVYALATIYSSIREIIADLRASRDISQQVAELESTVLAPYHSVVGQSLSELLFHVEGSISKHVKDPDVKAELTKKLKDTIFECATTLQDEYGLAIERVRKVLQ